MTTMPGIVVAASSFAYVFGLFAIAYWADRRADQGRSVIMRPSIYALSLAIYCTTWTFYGSIGRAASVGIGFLPIYIGPTLLMALGPLVLGKILRIAKRQRITSIADFIASRYGKSQVLGGIITLVAVVGTTPYIALQLKALSSSFDVLSGTDPSGFGEVGRMVLFDNAFYVSVAMAAFAIIFGTRHIDVAEHHPGLVAVVAFESVVKLLAFLAVGIFITYVMNDGFSDLFTRAHGRVDISRLFTATPPLSDESWFSITLLSMLAIICLPRQFQIMVIENVSERYLGRALWLFPLYLLLINLFVLPVAIAGLLRFPNMSVDPDMFLLALPLSEGWQSLALLVFIGGLSAATGMVIVEAVALSTMLCNDLIMPILLHLRWFALDQQSDLSRLLLTIRRVSIAVILLLGYAYVRFAGSAYALVSIGLISFAAVAQFAPALIGGLFWTNGSRRGAISGLLAGIAFWGYTLLLPSFARSGWFLSPEFIELGPWGLRLLRPYALFGVTGMDPLTHSLFWSGVFNIGLYIGVSLFDRPTLGERVQATAFVEVFQQSDMTVTPGRWRGSATVDDLLRLVSRFIGPSRAEQAFNQFSLRHQVLLEPHRQAGAELVRYAERLLAGAIGAASARVALASAVKGGEFSIPELMRMLDETSHVIEYSRQLEQKSAELERTSAALRIANEQLRELDRMKDDFLSTVTHELRTPLTSIRAFSEILYDDPDIGIEQRQEFLGLIIRESERLTRLINQVLDFAKIEAGQVNWRIEPVDLREVMQQAASATSQLFRDKDVALKLAIATPTPMVRGDYDRLMQVAVNLLSNAVKFTPPDGRVEVAVLSQADGVRVDIHDSGPGIAHKDAEIIFERFRQVGNTMTNKPQGTGLGLAICRRILDHLSGRIWVESELGQGATFSFVAPYYVEDSSPVLEPPSTQG
ncbi:Histidine kinase [Azospirillaceae bacterium]